VTLRWLSEKVTRFISNLISEQYLAYPLWFLTYPWLGTAELAYLQSNSEKYSSLHSSKTLFFTYTQNFHDKTEMAKAEMDICLHLSAAPESPTTATKMTTPLLLVLSGRPKNVLACRKWRTGGWLVTHFRAEERSAHQVLILQSVSRILTRWLFF